MVFHLLFQFISLSDYSWVLLFLLKSGSQKCSLWRTAKKQAWCNFTKHKILILASAFGFIKLAHIILLYHLKSVVDKKLILQAGSVFTCKYR